LRKQQVLKGVSHTFTGIPHLLDTGTGDRVSILLLFLYLLDRLDVNFHLLNLGKNVLIVIGKQITYIPLPGDRNDVIFSGHDQEIFRKLAKEPDGLQRHEVGPGFLLSQYHVYLSSGAISNGQNRVAIRHCVRAAILASDYSVPYSSMGIAYGNLGNYSEATRFFDKALELDPTRFSTFINYGNCLFKAGEVENAGEF